MNMRNTRFVTFVMLLSFFSRSKAMEGRSLPFINLNKGTSFLEMIKSNPDCLNSPRINRLITEYDKSMHEILTHAAQKPSSVLPTSFYLSANSNPPLPFENKSYVNWPSKDFECSYWCGLCNIKLFNSKEYDSHMLHCYHKSAWRYQ